MPDRFADTLATQLAAETNPQKIREILTAELEDMLSDAGQEPRAGR
jgi:hypothetical protein